MKDNKFSFKGIIKKDITPADIRIYHPDLVLFPQGDEKYYLPDFYIEKKDFEIKLEHKIFDKGTKSQMEAVFVKDVNGTKTSDIEKDYLAFQNENKGKDDYYSNLLKKMDTIITKDPKSPYSGEVFFELLRYNYLKKGFVNKDEAIKVYEKLDKNSFKKLRNNEIEKFLYPENYAEINQNLKDFELLNSNDVLFNTKSLKGKWILIDFWATWCGPCISKLPELKEFYKVNKQHNFEIVGVSVDTDKKKWKNYKLLPWINLNENTKFEGKTAMYFKVESIPTTYLINKEGKIVAKNISLEDLKKLLIEN